MSHSAVSLEELLADYEATATRWKDFFDANPGAALVPTDIAQSKKIVNSCGTSMLPRSGMRRDYSGKK